VAVVGAAPGNDAAVTVVRNLVDLGYPGPVYPVHPAAAPVYGLPAYPSLADLPGPVEAAALLVGAGRVPAAADAAVAAGAAGLWVFAGGRADGEAGQAMEAHLAGLAARTGVLVGGPNCMGVIAPTERFACWLGTVVPAVRPGRVAAVVQSGAVGEALVGLGGRVGWRAIVSTGNELVVEAAAVADRLLDDPDLACLALFLEGFRDPAAFVAVARRAAGAGVPVAAVKVGRSRAGRAGVVAHTGALAGEDRVVDALFGQVGVHRAADLDELVEFAVAAGAGLRPAGRRTFVVTTPAGRATCSPTCSTMPGSSCPSRRLRCTPPWPRRCPPPTRPTRSTCGAPATPTRCSQPGSPPRPPTAPTCSCSASTSRPAPAPASARSPRARRPPPAAPPGTPAWPPPWSRSWPPATPARPPSRPRLRRACRCSAAPAPQPAPWPRSRL